MADIKVTVTESIDAPVPAVFEYCRDPRRIYAEDPTYQVAEAAVASDGVGTTARLVAKMLIFPIESVAIEYVEVEPDQRIVFEARPTMTILGRHLGGEVFTWTWTFEPTHAGTTVTVTGVSRGGANWERALDSLFGTQKILTKQFHARLSRIKAVTEEQASTAA